MGLMSLRELIVLFDTQLQQLTATNLVNSFFPTHTLVVSIATAIVCASLALGTRSSAAVPVFFSSFSSFVAICIFALMMTTLLYRLTGGRFTYSSRATGDVVDWIMDTVCRPIAEDTAAVMLSPDKRRARGIFFVGLCVVAEVGKVLSLWSICTLLSVVWAGFSLRRFYVHNCVT